MLAFAAAVALILELEGGYVDHPADNGGPTKYGISQRAFPNVNIAALTQEEAVDIYRKAYWDPVAAEVTDPCLQILVFDTAVHSGVGTALSWVDVAPTFGEYLAYRINFLRGLDDWDVFAQGWSNRLGKVVNAAHEVCAPTSTREQVDPVTDHRPLLTRLRAAVRGTSGPAIANLRPLVDGTGTKLDLGPIS